MKIINFINSLKKEIDNICWPEIHTVIKITITIFITSALLSLILWILDKTLFFIISSIINLRFENV